MHESVGTLSETRAQLDRLSWTTRRSITWSNARPYICSNNHRTWLWGTRVIIDELYFCLCLPQSPRWLRRMERSYSAGDFNAWNEWRGSAGDFDAWNERHGAAAWWRRWHQCVDKVAHAASISRHKRKLISSQTFKHLCVYVKGFKWRICSVEMLVFEFFKKMFLFFTLHYGKSCNDLIRIRFWCEK